MDIKKQFLRYILPLLVIPGIVIVSALILPTKCYAAASVVIAFLVCVLISLSFDSKTTHVRNVVLISVMTALSVTGRFLFAVIPGFKPMTAIIVLTGIYLGKEAGFFCGAFTALISNMYFGQGPWTPFQMFSFGVIGFFAGVFCKILKKYPVVLYVFGGVAGMLYSFIMDVWTVLWYQDGFRVNMYLSALATAIPYTVSYIISNIVFLFLLRKPIGRKLDRICSKYLQL